MVMTLPNTQELRAAAQAATPGERVVHGAAYYKMWPGAIYIKGSGKTVRDAHCLATIHPQKPSKDFLDELDKIIWEREQEQRVTADAHFIALANPQTVLALIAENEALKADLKSYMDIANSEANEAEGLRAQLAETREALESWERTADLLIKNGMMSSQQSIINTIEQQRRQIRSANLMESGDA